MFMIKLILVLKMSRVKLIVLVYVYTRMFWKKKLLQDNIT